MDLLYREKYWKEKDYQNTPEKHNLDQKGLIFMIFAYINMLKYPWTSVEL